MHKFIKKEQNLIRFILQGYKKKQVYLHVLNQASWLSMFLRFLWVNKIIYGYVLFPCFEIVIYLKYIKNTLKILPNINFKFCNNKISTKQNVVTLKNLFEFEKNSYFFFKTYKKDYSLNKKSLVKKITGFFIFVI